MKNSIFRLLATVIIVAVCNSLNAQERIAVVDFKAGAGVPQGDTEGVSAIFTTYFADPDLFIMVERSQIDQVIQEQGFQMTALTNEDVVRIGRILNLQKMVIGDITIVSGQYNVDVRVIDIESGAVCATNGATWVRGSSYRELMRNLANNLKESLKRRKLEAVSSEASQENRGVVTLLGYLHVYPEDLGTFESAPNTVIAAVNKNIMYGYNDWRLPNSEEMSLIKGNAGQMGGIVVNATYLTSDKPTGGRVRLVTTGDNYEAKQRAEQTVREQQAQARKEQEAREAAYRAEAQRRTAAREQALSKLSQTDKVRYLVLTQMGMDIKYIPKVSLTNYPQPIFRGDGTELNYTDNRLEREGWKAADYVQLARIPELKALLQSCKFWYTNRFLNNYEAPNISVGGLIYGGLSSYLYLYDSQSNSLTKEVILFCTRQELGSGKIDPYYAMLYDECSISAIYVKHVEEGERIAEEMLRPYMDTVPSVNVGGAPSVTGSIQTTIIDHDYVNDLMVNHPQTASIQNRLTNLAKAADQEYNQCVQSFNQTLQNYYQQTEASLTEAQKSEAQSRLQSMREEVQSMQETLVKNFESKQKELWQPIQQSIYKKLTAIASGQSGSVGYYDYSKILLSMPEYDVAINEFKAFQAANQQTADPDLRLKQERLKQAELLNPIADKISNIINQVGSANGYAYIFDKVVMESLDISSGTMTDLTTQIITAVNTK